MLRNLVQPKIYNSIANTLRRQTDFYKNSSSAIDGKITYHKFSETDNVEHVRLKRPVVRHYYVTRAMEPQMDAVIQEFCDHLQKRFVGPKKTCEFGEWLAYCKIPHPGEACPRLFFRNRY